MSESPELNGEGFDPAAFVPRIEDAPMPDTRASKPRRSVPGLDGLLGRPPAGDESPRQQAARAKARATKPPLPPEVRKPGYFLEPIAQLYAWVGIGLMPIDPVCANGLMQCAEDAAKMWDELAQKNDVTRRMLYSITKTTLLGQLIAAHSPLIGAIMMHHVPAVQNILGGIFAQQVEEELNPDE
jgi:hypothetical protein